MQQRKESVVNHNDAIVNEPYEYHIALHGSKIRVGKDVWVTYPGRRYVNGNEFHGPVEDEFGFMNKGHRRECSCMTCQSCIKPELRFN